MCRGAGPPSDRSEACGVFAFDAFRLDAYARTLTFRGAPVALRPRTFALLEYFARNPGRTLGKRELFDALWPDEDVTEGNLSQQVFTLRAALARHAPRPAFVVTEPGRGYRFVARVTRTDAAANECGSAAQRLYLRGRFSYEKRTAGALRRSIGWFRRALAEDPSFAPAYAGLASAYALSGEYLALAPQVAFPRARETALRALTLDATSSEAHAVLGEVACYYDRDFAAADARYRDAVELAPHAVAPAVLRGWFLALAGRAAEGADVLGAAIAHEPCSLILQTTLAVAAIFRRRFDEAAELLRAVLDADPEYVHARYYLAMALQLAGRYREALALAGADLPDGYEQQFVALRGYLAARLGRRDEARACDAELRALATRGRYLSSYNTALLALGLGERDEAFARLERGLAARDPWSVIVLEHPQFDELRGGARFTALARRIALRPFEDAARATAVR
jgi:DNA-binding winged helix-turn-helix (wHTH) protein/Tfp pilus assembly protein PilF